MVCSSDFHPIFWGETQNIQLRPKTICTICNDLPEMGPHLGSYTAFPTWRCWYTNVTGMLSELCRAISKFSTNGFCSHMSFSSWPHIRIYSHDLKEWNLIRRRWWIRDDKYDKYMLSISRFRHESFTLFRSSWHLHVHIWGLMVRDESSTASNHPRTVDDIQYPHIPCIFPLWLYTFI